MLLPAFQNLRKMLKGNLHSHTTVSDGPLSPEDLVAAYCKKGYDFIVLTDHEKSIPHAPALGSSGFLVIRGVELGVENNFGGAMYHFVCVDVPGDFVTKGKRPQQVLDEVRASGALVYLAHPSWSGHGRSDLFPLHGYHGVEVANYGCREAGRMLSEDEWDDLNTWQGPTNGIAVDDGHRMNDIGGAWVMVNARHNTLKAVKEALQAGLFYSSSGPRIESVEIEGVDLPGKNGPVPGVKVAVKSTPSRLVCLRSVPTHGAFVEGDNLTIVELTAKRRDVFYRVVVEDKEGRLAWTNPFVPAALLGEKR